MNNRLRIAIFIPAYNAGRTLPKVLDRIPQDIKREVEEIFVVDNASEDNTYLIGIGYKHEKGLQNLNIYKNDQNIGYGGSQKVAYQYAIDRGYDVVVMLHGDAQYAPEKISFLLEPFRKGEADLVFGSRIAGLPLKGGMPFHRFLGNKALTWIENFVLDWNLSEFHSGYRIFSTAAVNQVPFALNSNYYHFDTDVLIQFKLKGLRVVERPIPTYYGDEICYVNIWRYGFSILGSLLQYVLHQRGIKRVKRFDVHNYVPGSERVALPSVLATGGLESPAPEPTRQEALAPTAPGPRQEA
ncbi:MAG: glycosyltransferase family 2 protein [Acidobacteriota bacterium]